MQSPHTPASPEWDLTPFFASLEAEEFTKALDGLRAYTIQVERFFDEHGISADASGSGYSEAVLTHVLDHLNQLSEKFRLLKAYVSGLVTVNSHDDQALATASVVDQIGSQRNKLSKRFVAWIGAAEPSLPTAETPLGDYVFLLEKAKGEAKHQLPPSEEALVSDLELTGSAAWKKLHSNVTSQIQVSIDLGKGPQLLSMSAVRNLASHGDRALRQRAYEAELKSWKEWEIPISAALNSIKGETLVLSKRRGWSEPLAPVLFGENLDPEALYAMMAAAREALPDFRRYLKLKARRLGLSRLAFFDLFAPLPGQTKEWDWIQGERFVAEKFSEYSDEMGSFARLAFRERWIDYPPRLGKVDGAYCMDVRGSESRILMNFKPSFTSVSTLAHELGHAYHNLCLSGRPKLLRTTPMSLAETASIFCETLIKKAALEFGDPIEKEAILEASLQGSCQVVVDIMCRFLFEQRVFEARKKRELSPSEFCELMLHSQLDTYGDALLPDRLHPYMWAAKPHYYGNAYYNFPYMFGLLFSLGLYACYRKEGKPFQARYDRLLSRTGMADVSTLAAEFGVDVRDKEFWIGSLDQIRGDVNAFERQVGPP